MSLINRLFHTAITCRTEVQEGPDGGQFIVVDERMFEDAATSLGDEVRVILARAGDIEPGPGDIAYFNTTVQRQLIPDEEGGPTAFKRAGPIIIELTEGSSSGLDTEAGDIVVYVLAPVSIIDGLPKPGFVEDKQTLAEILRLADQDGPSKPIRNRVANATGNSNVQQTKNQDIQVPEPTTDEIVQTNRAIADSGQVRIVNNGAEKLGVARGSAVYIEMENDGNTLSGQYVIKSEERFTLSDEEAAQLGINLDNAPGLKIDEVRITRLDD